MKYWSELTKTLYSEEDELKKAEEEYNEKHKKELALKEERATAAKEVEDAYKVASDAYKNYKELLNKFLKNYGAFHYSVTKDSGDTLLDLFFDSFWNF